MTTDYNNPNNAYVNQWLVYINGIECPAESVTVTSGIWQIPEATITMVPDRLLYRLGHDDRIQVQVFYLDQWQSPRAFRLLFDGEIVGWNYSKAAGQRMVQLRCLDYMQIFTQIFFFLMSSVDRLAEGITNEQVGAAADSINMPGFGPIYPYSLFTEGLIPPGDSAGPADYIKRPIDFVYNVVRGLTSTDTPNRSIPAANFFSPWARRTSFNKRFVALPMFEDPNETTEGIFPIVKATQANYAVSAVARLASEISNAGSVWDAFKQVCDTMLMEIGMITTPSIVTSDFETLLPGEFLGDASTRPKFLTNYFIKPQFIFGLPPTCNVFFPSMVESYGYNEDYVTQPTRMYFNDEAMQQFLNNQNRPRAGLDALIRNALCVSYPPEVNEAAKAAMETPNSNGKNLLTFEEFFKGPVIVRRTLSRWFTFLQQANSGSASRNEAPTTATAPGTTEAEGVTNAASEESPDAVPPVDTRLYLLYAKYEYFKEKYSRRQGGVQMPFNPYAVAGFPCAIFDDVRTQAHSFGYVSRVTHQLTNRGMKTSVSYTYGRTFQETFQLMEQQFSAENQRRANAEQRLLQVTQAVNAAVEDTRAANQADAQRFAEGAAEAAATVGSLVTAVTGIDTSEAEARATEAAANAAATAAAESTREAEAAAREAIRTARDETARATGPEATTIGSGLGVTESGEDVADATDTPSTTTAGEAEFTPDIPVLGRIDIAPPEPLDSVRAIIQNFNSADDFYKTFFGRGENTTTEETAIRTLADSENTLNVSGDVNTNPAPSTLSLNEQHVFRYDKIISIRRRDGENNSAEAIRITGLDDIARGRLRDLLTEAANGTQLDAPQIEQVNRGLGITTFENLPPETDPGYSTGLADINRYLDIVNNGRIETNLTGDVDIVPRPEAAHLFKNHTAAMRYASRPIVTLEEFIEFHEKGVKEGRVPAGSTVNDGTNRTFGATFYKKILDLTPGPPESYPSAGVSEGDVSPIPEDFPDTAEDWTSRLERYRRRILGRLPPFN